MQDAREQCHQMVKCQGNFCFICKKPETGTVTAFVIQGVDVVVQTKKTSALCVDHNHFAGEIHKLVSMLCNTTNRFPKKFQELCTIERMTACRAKTETHDTC